MDYILLMTIAGSGLFLGVFLMGLLMKNHLTESFRYWSLVLAMLAYLVPWVWLKDLYGNVGYEMLDREPVVTGGEVILGDAVIRSDETLRATREYGMKLDMVGVWMGGAILILILRSTIFIFRRERMKKHAENCEEGELGELIERLKREFGIKRKVSVVRIPGQKTSCTLGPVRPIVFLQQGCQKGEEELILRHEFTHIVRGDLTVKFFMELVHCLHWFNPFAYLLNAALDSACERSCDERVVRGRTNEERAAYAHLILKSATVIKKPKRKLIFGSHLATSGKQVEERIRVIMNKRERKVWEKVIAASVLAVLLFVDSLTALAYPDVNYVENATGKLMEDFVQGDGSLYRCGDYNEDLVVTVLHEKETVLVDGNVYSSAGTADPFLFCIHAWEEATFQTHVKNDAGGCEVNRYSCDYCPKCGRIVIGELLYTIVYVHCPHNYD